MPKASPLLVPNRLPASIVDRVAVATVRSAVERASDVRLGDFFYAPLARKAGEHIDDIELMEALVHACTGTILRLDFIVGQQGRFTRIG